VNVALSLWTALTSYTDVALECREVATQPPWEWAYLCKADWNDKSRISDEQRETFTVIATTLLVIGSRLRQR
jgi:hypothetical protein